jgi:hypothetical protein
MNGSVKVRKNAAIFISLGFATNTRASNGTVRSSKFFQYMIFMTYQKLLIGIANL